MASRGVFVWVVAVLIAGSAPAEVKLIVRPDGTKVMVNTDRYRRRSDTSLRPVREEGLGRIIGLHASRQRLDPRLVQAVIQVESDYDPGAVSDKGAQGLMQLMPETSRELRVSNPFNPEDNIRGGTTYLRRMLDEFGRLDLALAAYNAGPTAVERFRGIPPYAETRSYVKEVMLLAGRGGGASQGLAHPPSVRGRKVYLRRDSSNRLLITTSIPERGK